MSTSTEGHSPARRGIGLRRFITSWRTGPFPRASRFSRGSRSVFWHRRRRNAARHQIGRAPQARLAEAARAFPLAGLVVGLAGGLAYWIAVKIGLSGCWRHCLPRPRPRRSPAPCTRTAGRISPTGSAAAAIASASSRHEGQPYRQLRRARADLRDRRQDRRTGAIDTPDRVAAALVAAHVLRARCCRSPCARCRSRVRRVSR